jgi:acyl-CoA synthetase (AMP-forming)/AMP-acid ligase II
MAAFRSSRKRHHPQTHRKEQLSVAITEEERTRIKAYERELAVDLPELPNLRRVHFLPTQDTRVLPDTEAYQALFGEPGDPNLGPQAPAPDPSYVLFASGSTAHLKPALCPHGAYIGCAVALSPSLHFGHADLYTRYNPTFHSSGLIWNISLPHAVGGAGYLMPKFDASTVLAEITERKVTHADAFDTMLTMSMAAQAGGPANVSHIKGWSIRCTPSFMRRVMETWTLNNPSHIYGSTESSGIATLMPPDVVDEETRISTNGRPLPGIDVRIVDPDSGKEPPPGTPGEICFKGWSLFIEYLDMPEEREKSFDDDGVERPLEELRGLCKGKVAKFKIPKHFVAIEPGQWPVLRSGRIDKPNLQQRALDRLTGRNHAERLHAHA